MKKVLMFLLLVLLVPCAGLADHWTADQSLIPGTYMLIEIDEYKTKQMEFKNYTSPGEIIEWTGMDMRSSWWGVKLNITAENNVNGFLQYLNKEPMTKSTYAPILLYKNNGKWIHIPFPCRWVEGDGV
jgi:hypothetical protein